jgi:hypothetical protein
LERETHVKIGSMQTLCPQLSRDYDAIPITLDELEEGTGEHALINRKLSKQTQQEGSKRDGPYSFLILCESGGVGDSLMQCAK